MDRLSNVSRSRTYIRTHFKLAEIELPKELLAPKADWLRDLPSLRSQGNPTTPKSFTAPNPKGLTTEAVVPEASSRQPKLLAIVFPRSSRTLIDESPKAVMTTRPQRDIAQRLLFPDGPCRSCFRYWQHQKGWANRAGHRAGLFHCMFFTASPTFGSAVPVNVPTADFSSTDVIWI